MQDGRKETMDFTTHIRTNGKKGKNLMEETPRKIET